MALMFLLLLLAIVWYLTNQYINQPLEKPKTAPLPTLFSYSDAEVERLVAEWRLDESTAPQEESAEESEETPALKPKAKSKRPAKKRAPSPTTPRKSRAKKPAKKPANKTPSTTRSRTRKPAR